MLKENYHKSGTCICVYETYEMVKYVWIDCDCLQQQVDELSTNWCDWKVYHGASTQIFR